MTDTTDVPSSPPPPSIPPPPPPPPQGFVVRTQTDLERLQSYGVTNQEWAAMQLYTTSLYTLINAYLRGYATAEQDQQIAQFMERTAVGEFDSFDEFIELISSGMAKLPAYDATETVSRGVQLAPTSWNPSGLLEAYAEGQVVVDEGFMSTTFGTPFAKDSIVIIELPDQHPGRDLAWLSKFEQEKEILFPPGTEFVVTSQLARGEPGFDGVLAYLVHDEEERARRFGVVERIIYGTIMNWQVNPLYEPPEPEWQDNPAYEPPQPDWQDNPLYEPSAPPEQEWHDNPAYQPPEQQWHDNAAYQPPEDEQVEDQSTEWHDNPAYTPPGEERAQEDESSEAQSNEAY